MTNIVEIIPVFCRNRMRRAYENAIFEGGVNNVLNLAYKTFPWMVSEMN